MEKIGIVLHKLRSGVHGYEFKVNESTIYMPGDSGIKNSPVNSGDLGLIPESGRSPGEGNGNPLQYSCLKNSMDRGAWQATVIGSQKVRQDLATKQ